MRFIRRFRDLGMKVQLTIFFLAVGIVPLAITAWLCFDGADKALTEADTSASTSLKDQTFEKLVATRDLKILNLEKRFDQSKRELDVLAGHMFKLGSRGDTELSRFDPLDLPGLD